jgi:hypothetical protein
VFGCIDNPKGTEEGYFSLSTTPKGIVNAKHQSLSETIYDGGLGCYILCRKIKMVTHDVDVIIILVVFYKFYSK